MFALVSAIQKLCGLTIDLPNINSSHLAEQPQHFVVYADQLPYFLKTAPTFEPDICESEAIALKELADCAAIKTPKVICVGRLRGYSFLLLEHIRLSGCPDNHSMAKLVADIHAVHRPYYGWRQNNYIGATTQCNTPTKNWADFWIYQRLYPQHQLAKSNGVSKKLLEASASLQTLSRQLLDEHQPVASILHGDLWSGNIGTLEDGTAITFDPALYYGDPETDIAMTELFGGFGRDFYHHYRSIIPLHADYEVRKHLYNGYHLLNHINLFGEQAYGDTFYQTVIKLHSLM